MLIYLCFCLCFFCYGNVSYMRNIFGEYFLKLFCWVQMSSKCVDSDPKSWKLHTLLLSQQQGWGETALITNYTLFHTNRFTPRLQQFTDTISPVCLPQPGDEDRLPIGASCYATGKSFQTLNICNWSCKK